MIKLVFCCRRREGMTREAFQERWLAVHGPLVKRLRESDLPVMKRYVQSHSLPDEMSEGLRGPRGSAEPYDGITEVWFESVEALGADRSEGAIAASRALIADEAEFIDLARSSVFLTEEHEIF